ncbi:Mismatch repair protein msh3 [Blastocladiella emersonii ATCC 22665]|nr:Mismatch repair protein msh3 [Blastocladiella emersonii ATCC 22665]
MPPKLRQTTLSAYFKPKPKPAAAADAEPAPVAALPAAAPAPHASTPSPASAPVAAPALAAPPLSIQHEIMELSDAEDDAPPATRPRLRRRSDRDADDDEGAAPAPATAAAPAVDAEAERARKRAKFAARFAPAAAAAASASRDADDDDEPAYVPSDAEDDAMDVDEPAPSSSSSTRKPAARKKAATPKTSPAVGKGRATPAKGKGKAAVAELGPQGLKYTPLEKQVVELKAMHPGVLLAFEVGYKYRFFGEDAQIAADLLNIVAWMDKNFLTASVPVPRIGIHIRRLVREGHKVGLVQQTETAALKSVGSNAKGPFARKMTRLYSAATLIDDLDDDAGGSASDLPGGGSQSFILILAPGGTAAKPSTCMVAFDPTTAEIVVDEWHEAPGLQLELDARLASLAPIEVLTCGVAGETRAWIDRYAKSRPHPVRCEAIVAAETDAAAAASVLSEQLEEQPELLSQVLDLSPGIQKCFLLAMNYMAQFSLTTLFHVPLTIHHYASTYTFHLSSTALRSLDVFSPDASPCLYSLANQTATPPGARLLRAWLARPLVDADRIAARADAVDYLLLGETAGVSDIVTAMRRIGDGERTLVKLHCARIRPAALWSWAHAWVAACDAVLAWHSRANGIPQLLAEIAADVAKTRARVADLLASMHVDAAAEGDLVRLWTDDQAIRETREELEGVVGALESEAKAAAKPVAGTVTTVSGVPFLVQVPKSRVVPSDWLRVSATKQVTRYHPPRVVALLKDRDVLQETLAALGKQVYAGRLAGFSAAAFADLAHATRRLAEFDCLLALAALARNPGYVRPEFTDEQVVRIEEGRHPVLDSIIEYVPNSVTLEQRKQRCLILSGPNMGGKSSAVRHIALTIILAQIGSRVPAARCELGVFDGVYVRMGAADDVVRGASTFMVELRETQQCLAQATSRSLVILDELGRGTATHDGTAIAYAVLDHVVREVQPITLFVTHFPPLAQVAETYPDHARCAHMAFLEHGEGGKEITFLYQLAEGAAKASYGLNVARLAGIPESILDVAAAKSSELAAAMDEDEEGESGESLEDLVARSLFLILYTMASN